MKYLLLGSDVLCSSLLMFKHVVLGVQKIFELFDGAIKLDPLFVCGLRYAITSDASIIEPNFHRLDRGIRGFEELYNFVWSIMFPVIW